MQNGGDAEKLKVVFKKFIVNRVLQEAASLSEISALPTVSNVMFTGRPDKQIGRICQ